MLFVVPFRFGRASNYNSAKTATIEQLTILSRDLHKNTFTRAYTCHKQTCYT